jgi:DNA-binding transcriptional ArsR family regulator
MSQPRPDDERIIRDLEVLKIYFDPFRARILHLLAGEPRTIQQVAAALDVPFTRLYYQFNLLEKHGLIRVVDIRSFSGAVEEKVYQISARQFVVDRALLTVGDTDEGEDGLNVLLRTVLDDTREDVRHSVRSGAVDMTRTPPDPDALLLRRGSLQLSAERARWFYEQLILLYNQAHADPGEGERKTYWFLMGLYPTRLPDDIPGETP